MPTLPERRSPPPDRNQPDVDPPELSHAVEDVGVAREVHGARTRYDVAERVRGCSERATAALVLGWNSFDLERADLERLTGLDLHDALEATLAEQAPEPAWHDHRKLLVQLLERRQVEMVVVRVRDQHRIDAAQRSRIHRHGALQMRNAVSEQRICEKPNAVEVDKDRRVPDVLDSHRGGALHGRRYTQSLRACASGRPSSFFSVLFSICRIRSRVTPNALPTSSRVHGCEPSSP